MIITLEHLKERLRLAAQSFVSETEAAYFAELWLETHLKKSPRMSPIDEALADLAVWQDQADHEVKYLVQKPGVSLIDFNGLAPSLKIKQIHDDLEHRARTTGLAATGIINSSGITTLNMWSDGLAKKNMIGIAMFNGGTECAVPYGGTRGVLGTNPMAYAIPTADRPIVLDMATTEIPYFEIKDAKENNMDLRQNVAVDSTGRPTIIAAQALDDAGRANLLPIGGGVKGYGIMLLVEVLTGALIRSMLCTEQASGWNPAQYGALILAIDIDSLTDLSTFKSKVSQMTEAIRNEAPADGFESVSVPGDRGYQNLTMAMEVGNVEIADATIASLSKFIASEIR